MPFYQSIINAEGLHIECEGDENPLYGFFTGRKIFAPDELTARERMWASVQSEGRVREMVRQARAIGRAPTFRVTKLYEISFWTFVFGSCPKGFIFYPEFDGEEDDYRILGGSSPLR
ncbi:hypothetical protein FEM03_12405 [Phragmitibacter flavus]|uniref:Uncharacterized protein n=1 Tax=Phragmitibacter flavus TaxID=2576071 RepID=A0A5R8KDZ9_9BACT|nr:hypothetical protein [Phragmitibacter flavus]TLD70520.1 hypothetical protein FEM03_12405 [Phragmitibacter flavus]